MTIKNKHTIQQYSNIQAIMMSYQRPILGFLCLAFAETMSGCSSTSAGHVEKDQAQTIQVGTTTKHQLIEKLGAPNEVIPESNGIEKLVWSGTRNSLDAKTFIPFYGIVAGSGTTEASELFVWVNRSGVVTNYKYNKQIVTEDTFGNKNTKKMAIDGVTPHDTKPQTATAGKAVAGEKSIARSGSKPPKMTCTDNVRIGDPLQISLSGLSSFHVSITELGKKGENKKFVVLTSDYLKENFSKNGQTLAIQTNKEIANAWEDNKKTNIFSSGGKYRIVAAANLETDDPSVPMYKCTVKIK